MKRSPFVAGAAALAVALSSCTAQATFTASTQCLGGFNHTAFALNNQANADPITVVSSTHDHEPFYPPGSNDFTPGTVVAADAIRFVNWITTEPTTVTVTIIGPGDTAPTVLTATSTLVCP